MLETVQELQIMLDGLAKTEARIEHNALPCNTILQRTVEAFGQETVDVIEHVSVHGGLLHGLWYALHMHEHHRGATPGNQRGHLRIEAQRTDIVDQHCSCIEGCGCHTGTIRIDGDHRPIALHDLPNHWHRACVLHLWRHGYRAGARRLPTHVDNISASGKHSFGVLERLLELEVQSTVRERIGCHIQNTHDIGTLSTVEHP